MRIISAWLRDTPMFTVLGIWPGVKRIMVTVGAFSGAGEGRCAFKVEM
jgi:hypothetical protein